jgi:hypothetical protein
MTLGLEHGSRKKPKQLCHCGENGNQKSEVTCNTILNAMEHVPGFATRIIV